MGGGRGGQITKSSEEILPEEILTGEILPEEILPEEILSEKFYPKKFYPKKFYIIGSRFISRDNIDCPGVRSLQNYSKPNILRLSNLRSVDI